MRQPLVDHYTSAYNEIQLLSKLRPYLFLENCFQFQNSQIENMKNQSFEKS